MQCPECKGWIEGDVNVKFFGNYGVAPKMICPLCNKVLLIIGIKGLWCGDE